MKPADILQIRLHNQLLAGNKFHTPVEIVSWMGAMQSQNYEMAKWGIGVRLPGITNKQVEDAVNAGKIIRTHILRPTWHFVAAEDIHWMLELTAPHIKPTIISYSKMRGMEDEFVHKVLDELPGLFEEYGHLTRQEITEHLTNRGLCFVENYDVKDILSRAELEGMVCNGEVRGTKQTYTLLHKRVPKTCSLSREEAIERLTRRYFASHGPATVDDMFWWSGLQKREIRKGIEAIKHDFISEEMDGKTYWMPTHTQTPPAIKKSALLLPPFDEYVVSYRHREEIIDKAYYRKVLTMNGLFCPTIHWDGKIVGTWKRVVNKKGIKAELSFFETTPKKVCTAFDKAIQAYNKFLD